MKELVLVETTALVWANTCLKLAMRHFSSNYRRCSNVFVVYFGRCCGVFIFDLEEVVSYRVKSLYLGIDYDFSIIIDYQSRRRIQIPVKHLR